MNHKSVRSTRHRSGLLALVALAALAGCGVDGPPQRPAPREQPQPAPATSITLSGQASAGVVGSR